MRERRYDFPEVPGGGGPRGTAWTRERPAAGNPWRKHSMYKGERFKAILIQMARFVAQIWTNTISWEPILNVDHCENRGSFPPAHYFQIQGTNAGRKSVRLHDTQESRITGLVQLWLDY